MIVFATDGESETTPEQRLERLLDLPPSAKLVHRVLTDDAPLTQRQIRERTLLPARTTRDALGKLKERELVTERLYAPDARKRLYAPRSVADPEHVEVTV